MGASPTEVVNQLESILEYAANNWPPDVGAKAGVEAAHAAFEIAPNYSKTHLLLAFTAKNQDENYYSAMGESECELKKYKEGVADYEQAFGLNHNIAKRRERLEENKV